MKKMTKTQKRLAVMHTNIMALYYFPLVNGIRLIAWMRGWKVDPKRSEQDPSLVKEEFTQNGFKMVRFGAITWNTGQKIGRTTTR